MTVPRIETSMSRASRQLGLFWIACGAIFILGCGSAETGPSDDERIAQVVADISDASFEESRFTELFVAGKTPPDSQRVRYRIYMYRVRETDIQGNQATATVEVEHGTSGEIVGEYPWELQRIDDRWKLSSAGLPPP